MRREQLLGVGTRTQPILKRNRGNRQRDDRLEQMKQGPGVFVYVGGHTVREDSPTYKMRTKREPILDENSRPILDAAGRPRMREVGVDMLYDHKGAPMLGGVPDMKHVELDNAPVWGVDFPKGVPVRVESDELALKLRCLPFHDELEGEELAAFEASEGTEEAPKKRGRKPRHEASDES